MCLFSIGTIMRMTGSFYTLKLVKLTKSQSIQRIINTSKSTLRETMKYKSSGKFSRTWTAFSEITNVLRQQRFTVASADGYG